jgi:eukaryotic-like serine/threonine-protein kinase
MALMNPPGPDLKAIFLEALDHPAGPERAAYLDQACQGDATLRDRVESLLKAHDEAGGFLGAEDAPASARDATSVPEVDSTVSVRRPAITEGPGIRIGPYKLLQQIGEGGMGTVFMAEQEHPVRRRVALKVIKTGMDTGQVVARFEAERQALAIMDHPNIAHVLDAGATDTGRPFFVMELVKGVPITEFCDRNHLSPKERLEIFIPVCLAIQHAHQKGIIHRDIKPSNVLVTLHDGKPVPKIIDFGVAKAIDQRLTDKTMFTEFGQIVGTLEYMSPEQAEMGALDIDTRTDIYSLGVLLYELLTGSTPLEREKIRKAAYAEILKRIREEEPTKPSTRLSESKDALPSISAQRKIEPARLMKFVRGDLDWIVMKSLEKDRSRRYETANGFAKDIQRYLDGDPVEACPPSTAYKFKKFARKHRVALSTAGAFAVLLVAATAISAGLAVWANRERVRALAAEDEAREQKGRAEEREQVAIDAVKHFRDAVVESPDLKNTPSLGPLRKTLLKEPLAFFKTLRDQLQKDQDTRPESLARLGSAVFELGNLSAEIGDKPDALRAFEESLAIRDRLARENPLSTKYLDALAESHNNSGVLQRQMGRFSEAMASYEKAREIWERIARDDKSVTRFQEELAQCYYNIGYLQSLTGRLVEAMASCEKAHEIRERLAQANPSENQFQSALAQSHHAIGKLWIATDQQMKAMASYKRALAIREPLARENPAVTEFQSDLATSHSYIGYLQGVTGRPKEAMTSHKQALAIRQRLTRENPSVSEFQRVLAWSHHSIGLLQQEMDRPAEALASHEQALTIRERLARENPTVTQFQRDLAQSHDDIGGLQRATARPIQALESFEHARVIREREAREHPNSPDTASELGDTLNSMALIDLDRRQFDEARTTLTRALEWQRKALTANPNSTIYRQSVANHLGNLIRAAQGLGRADEVEQARRELADLAASDPATLALDDRLAAVLKGQAPRDDTERIQLASRAHEKTLHNASTRLYSEALSKDPKLADDRQAQHAYHAACAAALAASGQGKDEPPPDDAAKARLRQQALDWLKAELSAWNRVKLTSGPGNKELVARTLAHWKADADLASIRDEKELAKLPEKERAAFKRLWSDVDQLLTEAGGQ